MADSDPTLRDIKVFPRNLTARADEIVRGNSASTRPDSGVDNCYPGLEFDQRNLDRRFFPGLRLSFHRGDGALVDEIGADFADLRDQDLPLWLWTVVGFTTQDQESPPVIACNGLDGLSVWRRVHDLLPGRVALILGPQPGVVSEPPQAAFDGLGQTWSDGNPRLRRNAEGSVSWVVLAADRAAYLDEGGVIDDVYQPGELTSTLCAPWQYDFNDCGCFYWAASKPDLVNSGDGTQPYLNFQRRDRSPNAPADTPPADRDQWLGIRRQQELGYAELINGAWNDLPIVLNDRESEAYEPPSPPAIDQLWNRERVVKELTYLATVEHALAVEYLYSHYSIDSPLDQPDSNNPASGRYAAANEVFLVAIDEMHHMRWANEALALLQTGPSVGRAAKLGRELDRPFELAPLTPQQLDWYIEVEAPSQAINEGLDGMYVHLHMSIAQQPDLFPERDRLVPLIKLIIDEGDQHWRRFRAVKTHLSSIAPTDYLRSLTTPQEGTREAALAKLSDQNYAVLIGMLYEAFLLGDRSAGLMIEQARRAMYNLHETNHFLASRGIAPPFSLPDTQPAVEPQTRSRPAAKARLQTLQEVSSRRLDEVDRLVSEPTEQDLVQHQRAVLDSLFAATRQILQNA